MLLDPMQARRVLAFALERRFALLAVNADSPAAITDVLEAAREVQAPVMIEASLWQLQGRSFGAGDAALGMARYLVQIAMMASADRYRGIPVLFHTDHIKGPATVTLLKAAIQGLPTGIGGGVISPSTVSLDSSALSEERNVASVVELCREAEACGRPLTFEMEAGVDEGVTPDTVAERLLGGVESMAPGYIHLWAPGVGTQHGLGEQTGFSPEAVARHAALARRVTGRAVGIALHGSSGLSEGDLRAAVAAGVTKVNWSSESLLIRSRAAQEYFATRGPQLDKGHPDWKVTAMDDGVQTFVAERYVGAVTARMRVLGGAGLAAACVRAAEG
jgi:fructose-bisphosphate aldolase, class II